MAGIDNNTVLYLRGDSFRDLSPSKIDIVNNGVTIIDNSVKYLNFNGNGNFLNVDKSVIYDYIINDFTIEFYVKSNTTSRQMILMLDDDVSGNGTQETISMNLMSNIINVTFRNTSNNIFKLSSSAVDFTSSVRHVALVRSGNLLSIYIDGINVGKQTISGSLFMQNAPLAIGRYGNYNGVFFNGIINNLRISNIVRYTEDFTPPTQPFNSISINVTNKTFSQIDFNVTKLSQETINKVEVLVNNIVSETYTDNFNNLTYNIDNSLCAIGDNNITIRVTYDGNYVEEEVLTHYRNPNKLPNSSSLKDVIDRQELLNDIIEFQMNNLKNILVSKNVEVAEEENKLSSLIDKVNELGEYDNPILYLYNEGDECVDVTGGWGESYNSGDGIKDFNKYDKFMNIAVSNQNTKLNISTLKSIDVTNYSKLKIRREIVYSGSLGYRFGLTSKRDTSLEGNDNIAIYTSWDESINNGKEIIDTLDVSTIKQNCFVNVCVQSGVNSNVNCKIYKIWLEK